MKKTKKNIGQQVSLALICLLLGFTISLQLKSVRLIRSTPTENLRATELQAQLNAEMELNQSLTKNLEEAKRHINEFRKNSVDSGAISELIYEQLDNAENLAGLTPLAGPGVTVTLADAKNVSSTTLPEDTIIHDSDIRTVVNELLASGAEAISINGQRIVSTSSIRCVGPTVIVNNTRLSSPFTITAIGDSKTLEAGLIIKGGVVDALTPWGINITITKLSKVTVPAYSGITEFKYAMSTDISSDNIIDNIVGGGQ